MTSVRILSDIFKYFFSLRVVTYRIFFRKYEKKVIFSRIKKEKLEIYQTFHVLLTKMFFMVPILFRIIQFN